MANWEHLRSALAQAASEGKPLVVACKPEDHGSLLDFARAVGEPRGLGATIAEVPGRPGHAEVRFSRFVSEF